MKHRKVQRGPSRGKINPKCFPMAGIVVCVIVAAVLLGAGVRGILVSRPFGWEQVASINGEPVTAREFRQQILQKRGEVATYFREKYGAVDSPGFWTSEFGGEVPAEVVRARAMEAEVRMKIQLEMAREAGLIRDIHYNALMDEMKKENRVRKQKTADHEVFYGLSSFTEQTYPAYRVSQLALDLRDRDEQAQPPDEAEIRAYYEAHKDPDYVSGKAVSVSAVRMSYENSTGAVEETLRNKNSDKAEHVLKLLDAGSDFSASARTENAEVISLEFSLSTARRDASLYPELRKTALSLNPGETSRVTEDAHAFWILRCTAATSETWFPFVEVREKVLARLLDERYEARVLERRKSAEIKLNTTLIEKMSVRE